MRPAKGEPVRMRLFDIFWPASKAPSCFRYCVLLIALFALAGCRDERSGSDNEILISRSASGTIHAMSGQTRTLSLTFTSSDQATLTDLVVTTNLAQLPSGWVAPSSFTCAVVFTGSECVLNLSYSP